MYVLFHNKSSSEREKRLISETPTYLDIYYIHVFACDCVTGISARRQVNSSATVLIAIQFYLQ